MFNPMVIAPIQNRLIYKIVKSVGNYLHYPTNPVSFAFGLSEVVGLHSLLFQ